MVEERFYFVRHGETDANLGNLAAGSGWDIELNATGLAQAKALAESPAIQDCHDVKTICVSPLIRAQQTAQALSQVLQAPLVTVDLLSEWHLGEWERRAWAELPSLYDPSSNPPGGESQLEFGMRVHKGLQQALAMVGPVLIVAHGGVWHVIAKVLQLEFPHIHNCEMKKIWRPDSTSKWAITPHTPDEK